MKTLTLSVVQFNTFVKNIFDAEEFLHDISVFGEVTNFKVSGGNAYFDLKDEAALLSCVKFGASDLAIKNGDRITVFGKVNFYVKSGRLNFIVGRAESLGMGDLYQKFLELKQKLEAQGLFSESIKKAIPRYANKVGVVTSETGAVIRDIINVARSKNPYTDIIVYPSRVQGVGAEDELANGINYFDGRSDINTIIVARGGGSIEDLSPFNTEKIVRAIYSCSKPVISAVGHETDFTLCDFAADLRVPTPSVAAEVAFYDYYNEFENLSQICSNNYYYLTKKVNDYKQNLNFDSNSIIDRTKIKLEYSKNNTILTLRDIQSKIKEIFTIKSNAAESIMLVLEKLSPMQILKKGYSVVESGGKRLKLASSSKIGEELNIKFLDGDINATVNSINLKEKK